MNTQALASMDIATEHACVVDDSKHVHCFGSNTHRECGSNNLDDVYTPDQPNHVDGTSGVFERVRVASGYSCALREDQSLWCWGAIPGMPELSTFGRPAPIPGLGAVADFDVAPDYGCAVLAGSGAIKCWGRDIPGAMGQTYRYEEPAFLDGAGYALSVRAANSILCILDAARTLRCLGDTGRLEHGAQRGEHGWVSFPELGAIQSYAVSWHVCAIDYAGVLFCWGHNRKGQLGAGLAHPNPLQEEPYAVSLTGQSTCHSDGSNMIKCFGKREPVTLPSDLEVTALASHIFATCACTSAGQTWCWGDVSANVTRFVTLHEHAGEPMLIEAFQDAALLSIEHYHACMVDRAGETKCMGLGANGRLGNESEEDRDEMTEVALPPTVKVEQLDTGDGHSCIRSDDKQVWCWGRNDLGQLGDGGTTDRLAPVLLGLEHVVDLGVGHGFACALSQDGQVFCWGQNEQRQTGDAALEFVLEPREVPNLVDVRDIEVGTDHACALSRDGDVYCWGARGLHLGRTVAGEREGLPARVPGLPRITRLFASVEHTCGLDEVHTLWCWGDSHDNQLGNPWGHDWYEPLRVYATPEVFDVWSR